MEFELLLADRINIIKDINKKFDLENNSYISFSGGKDSTILHYLIDLAMPNNNIPRVFFNTGIEYNDIVAFVKELSKKDKRFVILKPKQKIKTVLEKYGYPFKSKEHSLILSIYQNSGNTKTVSRYLDSNSDKLIKCPSFLKYQFSKDFNIKISDKCCSKLKKEPAKQWAKQNNKTITLTGMRKAEKGQRQSISGCAIFDSEKRLVKFHPLLVVDDEFEKEFVKKYNIKLCKLYYEPFNFERTGCKGCPFSIDLKRQLEIMAMYLQSEKKQCEFIWKPIYDEYRKRHYRLDNTINLFDYNERN